MKVVIIGGVAGGASSAARLRRLDERAEIIVFERSGFVSYANCGLPYYSGGTIAEKRELTLQTPESFWNRFRIRVKTKHEVLAIDPAAKTVTVKDLSTGKTFTESYDKLVLSPGAMPTRPPLPGIDSERVFSLRTVEDTLRIHDYVRREKPQSAVLVGGGYIGIEVAENLRELGLDVTIVQRPKQLMNTLDYDMATFVHAKLREKGIRMKEVPGAGWVDNPFLVETLCQTDAIAYLDTCYYCYREDTTEKALAFAERNPLLPLERWCDMAEVLERLGVADESVWRAQNLRGITYCCTAIEANGLDYPGLREKVVGIFSAMDPALVLDDPRIKPGEKRLFCELLGLPEPDVSDLAYMPELAKQAFYRLRMAGPRFTWLSVVDYLKRKRAREGR